jgi:release factor glutamine methyltransferase
LHTIRELLSNTKLDKNDARILVGHLIQKHLGWSRSHLISRDQELLPNPLITDWQILEKQRLQGVPVAYLTGRKAFHGIELLVNESVLIPRPETEILVDLALDEINRIHSSNKSDQSIRILDLGTGSGAIALAIAHALKNFPEKDSSVEILGIDLSGAAIQLARQNANALNLTNKVHFLESNWYESIPSNYLNNVDLIISNPPYIRAGDPHLVEGDLRFEAKLALTDNNDGLDCIRTILAGGKQYLKKSGLLALEHGYDQGAQVRSLMSLGGYQEVASQPDLAGHLRVSLARA